MNPCLKKRLNKTVTIASPVSYSSSGTPTLGPQREIKAYVEIARDENNIPLGTETATMHRLWVEDEVFIDDCIWLPEMNPANDDPRTPQAVEKFCEPMIDAVSHYEVII